MSAFDSSVFDSAAFEVETAPVAYSLSVTSASLLMAGSDVAIRASRRVALQPAALAVESGNVALRVSRAMAVSAASLAIQAGEVQLCAARRLTVAPTSMTVAGNTIQFTYTPAPLAGSYTMPITPAALALAGGYVGMRVARRIKVDAADFGLASHSIELRYSVTGTPIDASAVPAARTVVFGGGKRVVIFNGGIRVVGFTGGIRTVRF